MGKSCKEIAESLVDCIKKSDCVLKQGGTVRDCIGDMSKADGDCSHSQECQELRNAYFNCKRGSLDMRNRIRGPRVY
jgi:cytochrome c oxidase assembly factor 5